MSIVALFTRDQWEHAGGWNDIEAYVDGVVLLWDADALPDEDVLPVIITRDPRTGARWPSDAPPLPPVPYQFYRRDEERGGWKLEETGDDWPDAHQIVYAPDPAAALLVARP